MNKKLVSIIAAGILSLNVPPKSAQNVFDNVYMQLTYKDKNVVNTSIYNFKDDDSLSYYLGCKHFLYNFTSIDSIEVVDFSNSKTRLKLHNVSDSLDVCITKSLKDGIKPSKTKIIKFDDLILGEDCYVVGYPMGLYRNVKKTNISALLNGEDKVISVDGICAPGYSGGPIFVKRNGKLRLAGIVTAYMNMSNTSLAIPVDYFEDMLK